MRTRLLAILFLLLLTLLLTGCGLFKAPPKIDVTDVTFEWGAVPTVRGRAVNSGGSAKYVELAFKLTATNDPNHIYMTGWTNFSSFGAGESRPFSIFLNGESPNGEFRYHWRVATKAGSAMY